MPSDPRIRASMERLSKSLASPGDVHDRLEVLTAGAVDSVPGVDFASITLNHPDGRLETIAPTDQLIFQADQLQYQLQEGPCFEAVNGSALLVSEDIAHDDRWPVYGPKAAELGLRAQMGVQLTTIGRFRSALNLYARLPQTFDPSSMELAELFASHAAVAMGFLRQMESLSQGLETRTLIGQAIGIVMERYQIDHERAFQFLVRTSMDSNVKLREVAHQIVSGLEGRTRLPSVDAPADDSATGHAPADEP